MKVLVIDDIPEVLKSILSFIRRSQSPDGKSFNVEGVSNYEKALKRLKKKQFDIVVIDMRLGEKGDEGLIVLGCSGKTSPIAIILTGYSSIPNCVEAMRAGAWDYIEKQPMDGSDPYKRLIDSMYKAYEHRLKNPERGTLNPDSEWVHNHFNELIKKHPGKVVAILFEKVVDSDISFAKLVKRVDSKFPLAKPTIVSIPALSKGGV